MANSTVYAFHVYALFVCISVLSYYIHQQSKNAAMGNRTFIISPFYDPRNDKETPRQETITAMGNRTFIISPFYDPRNDKETPRQETITAMGNRTFIISPFYDPRNDKETPRQETITAMGNRTFIISPFYDPRNDKETPRQETITAMGNRTFIISPFYDPRNDKEVRVLSIVHVSVKELYCVFHCRPNQMVPVRGQIDIHSDRFGFPYGTADILCKEPSDCDYDDISIQESNSTSGEDIVPFRVRNHPPEPYTDKFTVCISAVFGQYNNVLQAIQSIEMYRLLGASRVTIYNNSCSQAMDEVLRYYSQQGFVEVVQWPIDRHLLTSTEWRYTKGLTSQIGYYGQTAALNDCLYRNMYRSKYVLLNDLDEIILPVKHWDWASLMVELEKTFPGTNVFCVESHTFPISANASGFDLWTKVPGVNILSHPFREPINRNEFNNRKLIVNPRQVLQTSIHSALKFKGQSMDLDQNMAITFHCRKGKKNDVSQKDLIEDQILRRYNLSLVPNVQKVIDHVFSKN